MIVAINETPPYRIVEGDTVFGIYVDIFEALLAEMGWQAKYREVPFRRAIEMLARGEADIMLGPLRTSDREKYIDFSIEAFPPVEKIFLANSTDHLVHNYEGLTGMRIGVQRGSAHNFRFDEDATLTKVPATSYPLLLRMLARDRLDAVLIPSSIGKYLMAEMGLDLLVSPFTFPGEPSYLAVSKRSELTWYLDSMKRALQTVKENGVYNEIVQRYEQPAIQVDNARAEEIGYLTPDGLTSAAPLAQFPASDIPRVLIPAPQWPAVRVN